jgi:hypothetical protein
MAAEQAEPQKSARGDTADKHIPMRYVVASITLTGPAARKAKAMVKRDRAVYAGYLKRVDAYLRDSLFTGPSTPPRRKKREGARDG